MLIEYCPSYRQMKENYKCKRMASIKEDKIKKPDFHTLEGEDG